MKQVLYILIFFSFSSSIFAFSVNDLTQGQVKTNSKVSVIHQMASDIPKNICNQAKKLLGDQMPQNCVATVLGITKECIKEIAPNEPDSLNKASELTFNRPMTPELPL
jgi:hypothetical protein